MKKYKSFVLGAKSELRQKSRNTPIPTRKKVLVPKKEEGEIVVAHYDKNEPIELSLPQSLSLAYELDHINDNHDESQDILVQGQSASYSEIDEDYSEANAYFSEADSLNENASGRNQNRFSFEHSDAETASAETTNVGKTIALLEPSNNSVTDYVEKEVTKIKEEQKITIPSDEKIKEEDQKFQDDLKSIMEGKKIWDEERIKKDPSAKQKQRNHGRAEKEDKQIEDKIKNDHAIFDKIAKSMEMAESYDLGSITIDKKFDDLEKETDQEFTKKINAIIDDGKKKTAESNKGTNQTSNVVSTPEQKEEKSTDVEENEADQEDDKILTKDFLDDLDQVEKVDKPSDTLQKLASQASFSSTISIKHRHLKSRVFPINSGGLEVMINSHWNPSGCSTIRELNVSLTEQKDLWPDTDHGTRKFRIGGPDTQNWINLPKGQYYLTFYFTNNTNPHCELTGTVDVRT